MKSSNGTEPGAGNRQGNGNPKRRRNRRKIEPSANGQPPIPPPRLAAFPAEAEAFETVRAVDVRHQDVDWLSPGRLSMGALWLLDGNKGTGKSSIAASIAAAVTGGPELPGGKVRCRGSVLWFAGEESLSTVKAKLAAAGADLTLVHFPGRGVHGETLKKLAVAAQEDLLEATVSKHAARLMVLDTLSCFADGVDLNQDQPARTLTSPLTRIAQSSGCLVFALRHPRKTPVSTPLDRGMGNPSIAAAARGVLTTGKEPDCGRRVLGVLAGNDSGRTSTICYDLVDCNGVPRVEWGEEIPLDPERIEFGVVEEGVELVRMEAKQLLRRRIGNAWVQAAEVIAEARKNGISQDALDRARWKLGVQSKRVGKLGSDGHWEYGPPPDGWPQGL